jgi:hypothetical protein
MDIEGMQPIDVLRMWQSNYVLIGIAASLTGNCYVFRARNLPNSHNTDEYRFRPHHDLPQLRTFLRFQFQLSQESIDKLFPVQNVQ